MRKAFPILFALLCLASLVQAQEIRRLESPAAILNLQPGSRLVLYIRAMADAGPVYGTDVYTGDSNIAAAAVHAGLLASGQTGVVTIDFIPGIATYVATKRNGVTSQASNAYPTAFKFYTPAAAAPPAPPAPPPPPPRVFAFSDAGILSKMPLPKPGSILYFNITGSRDGAVYGSGPYSINSSLPATAVHAGALAHGQKALIAVTILAGQPSYQSLARNGVTSQSYGATNISYSVIAVTNNPPVTETFLDPGSVATFPGAEVNKSYAFWVNARTDSGMIWGTDVYTSDSDLASAAVHSGILANGESGVVLVKVLPGRDRYDGSTRNGVTSSGYTSWGLSYSFEKTR